VRSIWIEQLRPDQSGAGMGVHKIEQSRERAGLKDGVGVQKPQKIRAAACISRSIMRLLPRTKPKFSGLATSLTHGWWARTMSGVPSCEALSMTQTMVSL
jgi:hypothetical protein